MSISSKASTAPIPMATMMGKEWGGMGQNYLRSLLALAFQGFHHRLHRHLCGAGTEYAHIQRFFLLLRRINGIRLPGRAEEAEGARRKLAGLVSGDAARLSRQQPFRHQNGGGAVSAPLDAAGPPRPHHTDARLRPQEPGLLPDTRHSSPRRIAAKANHSAKTMICI